uniref:Uncharacterized protein n=1 Tax=Cacopsylla melanoneura TaxID=428564 RepID=A0A8D8TPQ1_9HEMI
MLKLRGYDKTVARHVHDRTRGGLFNPAWRHIQHFYLDSRDFYNITFCPHHAAQPLQLALDRIFYHRPERIQRTSFAAQSGLDACLRKYARATRTRVFRPGLYVRPDYPHLSARPHGVYVWNRTELNLIEIYQIATNESITNVHTDPLFKLYKRKKCILNKTHPVYYNIQSMLTIANKSFCDLVLMTNRDMFIKRIYCNSTVFRIPMLHPVYRYYAYTYLPQLVRYFLHLRMYRYTECDNLRDLVNTDFVSLNQFDHFFSFAAQMYDFELKHNDARLEKML